MSLHTRLKTAAAALQGMEYGTGTRVRFPAPVPGIPASLVDPRARYIDCSSYTAWMLLSAYQGRIAEPSRLYRDLQIIGDDRWSPIAGVVRERLGVEVATPPPGRWCLVQLWHKTRHTGHAVLVRQEIDGLWVWESKQGRGPGLRSTSWEALTQLRSARLAVLEE